MSCHYGHGPALTASLGAWARQATAELRAEHQRAADDAQHERELRAERDARHREW